MISQYPIPEEDTLSIIDMLQVPFALFPNRLYKAEDLYDAYKTGQPETLERCYDSIVYRHYLAAGKHTGNIKETLARTLHDHAISDALRLYLTRWREEDVVGVMGGHGLLRNDPKYRQVVIISKLLTELGKLMITGGGPGAMEATHVGAWMAGRTLQEVEEVIALLSEAPSFQDEGWLDKAFQVRQRWPQTMGYESIGIPTWLYGHEPSCPFATHIAKYFDNSIREDGILTLAFGGIIYSPGSAGTVQEIFQEAVQSHYLSFGYASPMVFLGRQFWCEEMPIYPFLQEMMKTGKYKNLLLSNSDDIEEIVKTIMAFKPKRS